jgi:hypothetical protein
MGPTKVEDIEHLPNVVIKPGRSVKFFLCDNGHIEPWVGEPDNSSLPWRPCRQCNKPMQLTSRRIHKDGTLTPTKTGPRAVKAKVPPKELTEKVLLHRLARGLVMSHPYASYKVEWVSDTLIRVTRAGDRPWQQGNRIYRRYVEVTVDPVEMKARINCVGVSGWFEEFRIAAKRVKLFPVGVFNPPLSTLIVRKAKAKGGQYVESNRVKRK